MSRLTAIYEIELPGKLRTQRAEDDELLYAPGPALLGERAFTAADDSNFEECLITGIISETYQELITARQRESEGLTEPLEGTLTTFAPQRAMALHLTT